MGNPGQANYSAAKMGIIGLSKSLALDMAKFNVRSNCISPFAWSRMVGSIPNTPDQEERLKGLRMLTPDKIAPVAVFLASEDARGGQRTDFRGAGKRDLPDEPAAAAAFGASVGGLDPGNLARSHAANTEDILFAS